MYWNVMAKFEEEKHLRERDKDKRCTAVPEV
jgi:hypothetical protein